MTNNIMIHSDPIFAMKGGNPYYTDGGGSDSETDSDDEFQTGGDGSNDILSNIDTRLLYYIVYLLDPAQRAKIVMPSFKNIVDILPTSLNEEQNNVISNNKFLIYGKDDLVEKLRTHFGEYLTKLNEKGIEELTKMYEMDNQYLLHGEYENKYKCGANSDEGIKAPSIDNLKNGRFLCDQLHVYNNTEFDSNGKQSNGYKCCVKNTRAVLKQAINATMAIETLKACAFVPNKSVLEKANNHFREYASKKNLSQEEMEHFDDFINQATIGRPNIVALLTQRSQGCSDRPSQAGGKSIMFGGKTKGANISKCIEYEMRQILESEYEKELEKIQKNMSLTDDEKNRELVDLRDDYIDKIELFCTNCNVDKSDIEKCEKYVLGEIQKNPSFTRKIIVDKKKSKRPKQAGGESAIEIAKWMGFLSEESRKFIYTSKDNNDNATFRDNIQTLKDVLDVNSFVNVAGNISVLAKNIANKIKNTEKEGVALYRVERIQKEKTTDFYGNDTGYDDDSYDETEKFVSLKVTDGFDDFTEYIREVLDNYEPIKHALHIRQYVNDIVELYSKLPIESNDSYNNIKKIYNVAKDDGKYFENIKEELNKQINTNFIGIGVDTTFIVEIPRTLGQNTEKEVVGQVFYKLKKTTDAPTDAPTDVKEMSVTPVKPGDNTIVLVTPGIFNKNFDKNIASLNETLDGLVIVRTRIQSIFKIFEKVKNMYKEKGDILFNEKQLRLFAGMDDETIQELSKKQSVSQLDAVYTLLTTQYDNIKDTIISYVKSQPLPDGLDKEIIESKEWFQLHLLRIIGLKNKLTDSDDAFVKDYLAGVGSIEEYIKLSKEKGDNSKQTLQRCSVTITRNKDKMSSRVLQCNIISLGKKLIKLDTDKYATIESVREEDAKELKQRDKERQKELGDNKAKINKAYMDKKEEQQKAAETKRVNGDDDTIFESARDFIYRNAIGEYDDSQFGLIDKTNIKIENTIEDLKIRIRQRGDVVAKTLLRMIKTGVNPNASVSHQYKVSFEGYKNDNIISKLAELKRYYNGNNGDIIKFTPPTELEILFKHYENNSEFKKAFQKSLVRAERRAESAYTNWGNKINRTKNVIMELLGDKHFAGTLSGNMTTQVNTKIIVYIGDMFKFTETSMDKDELERLVKEDESKTTYEYVQSISTIAFNGLKKGSNSVNSLTQNSLIYLASHPTLMRVVIKAFNSLQRDVCNNFKLKMGEWTGGKGLGDIEGILGTISTTFGLGAYGSIDSTHTYGKGDKTSKAQLAFLEENKTKYDTIKLELQSLPEKEEQQIDNGLETKIKGTSDLTDEELNKLQLSEIEKKKLFITSYDSVRKAREGLNIDLVEQQRYNKYNKDKQEIAMVSVTIFSSLILGNTKIVAAATSIKGFFDTIPIFGTFFSALLAAASMCSDELFNELCAVSTLQKVGTEWMETFMNGVECLRPLQIDQQLSFEVSEHSIKKLQILTKQTPEDIAKRASESQTNFDTTAEQDGMLAAWGNYFTEQAANAAESISETAGIVQTIVSNGFPYGKNIHGKRVFQVLNVSEEDVVEFIALDLVKNTDIIARTGQPTDALLGNQLGSDKTARNGMLYQEYIKGLAVKKNDTLKSMRLDLVDDERDKIKQKFIDVMTTRSGIQTAVPQSTQLEQNVAIMTSLYMGGPGATYLADAALSAAGMGDNVASNTIHDGFMTIAETGISVGNWISSTAGYSGGKRHKNRNNSTIKKKRRRTKRTLKQY